MKIERKSVFDVEVAHEVAMRGITVYFDSNGWLNITKFVRETHRSRNQPSALLATERCKNFVAGVEEQNEGSYQVYVIRGGIEDGRIGTWISPNIQEFILRNVNAGREWIAAIEYASARIRGPVGLPVDWSTKGPEVADKGSVHANLDSRSQQIHDACHTVVGFHLSESESDGYRVSANRQSHGTQPASDVECFKSVSGSGIYSVRGAHIYLDGQRVGQCDEIELPTTEQGAGEVASNQVGFITQDGGEQLMSSIDLLEMVNSAREAKGESRIRRNVFNARIRDELEGDNYKTFVVDSERGSNSVGYMLTKDQCILVAMRESKAVRVLVRDRLKTLESAVVQPVQQFQIPQTMAEALRLAADENEGRLKAEAQALEYKGQSEQFQKQIETQTPWVEFARTVSETGDNMMVREAAKALNVKPSKLFQHLKDWGWINSKRVPYQRHIDAGYLEYRVHNYTKPTGDVATTYVPLITGKGLGRIHRLLNI